jgi:uncharacterized protein YxjI
MAAPPPPPPPGAYQQPAAPANIWTGNFYRIRKKVLAIANQYWIEDQAGNILGYSKQKLLKLKEDIRIYSDDTMQYELFKIQQTQIIDAWGKFMIIDSATNQSLGYFKRKALMSGFIKDEYEFYSPADQMVGRLAEGTGRGIMRKFIGLIPEKLTLEYMGRPVTEIRQQFKIIGDIWEVDCTNVGPELDRRVLLGGLILMGMIERDRK